MLNCSLKQRIEIETYMKRVQEMGWLIYVKVKCHFENQCFLIYGSISYFRARSVTRKGIDVPAPCHSSGPHHCQLNNVVLTVRGSCLFESTYLEKQNTWWLVNEYNHWKKKNFDANLLQRAMFLKRSISSTSLE